MPFNLGVPELLIILAIVVLLFGATRLAGVGGALGRAIREFRRELREPTEPPEGEGRGQGQPPQPPAQGPGRDRPEFRH
ncbi:Sec-independent protein translocase protein TatA [bacterium HR25]|jgi:sec-independent protein translocase protein TatA|nr:Sec-independent protein translocase protein TatA [bacterium HR25]